jgi:hypothetical protein
MRFLCPDDSPFREKKESRLYGLPDAFFMAKARPFLAKTI